MSDSKWQLVPVEPTPEIMAAAAMAAWPLATEADLEMGRHAARIILMHMDIARGASLEMIAASVATMAPAYRAMLAAAPQRVNDSLLAECTEVLEALGYHVRQFGTADENERYEATLAKVKA